MYKINDSEKLNDIIYINCKIIESSMVLKNIIAKANKNQGGKIINIKQNRE